MIGDVTLENIYCNGALGKFRDGLAFTCNTANDGPADANNEQASILNCYFELAGRYGIAFQHQNSLWHRIIGGRVSGYSACIVNHREDGSTGGSFQLMNTTVMGLTDTSKLFQLVSAAYPISIINTESEGGSILLQSRGDARVTFTNCSWKLSNASANNVEISNTSRVTFENCLFLAPLGVNFIVKDPTSYLFIHEPLNTCTPTTGAVNPLNCIPPATAIIVILLQSGVPVGGGIEGGGVSVPPTVASCTFSQIKLQLEV